MDRPEAARALALGFVVDAGVALKWLVDEPLRDRAMDLIDWRLALHAPQSILAEIDDLVCRKLRQGEIDTAHARRIVECMPGYFDLLHPPQSVGQAALEIALRLGLPLRDGIYLACVRSLGLPLITADERLLEAVAHTSYASQVVRLADFAPQS